MRWRNFTLESEIPVRLADLCIIIIALTWWRRLTVSTSDYLSTQQAPNASVSIYGPTIVNATHLC